MLSVGAMMIAFGFLLTVLALYTWFGIYLASNLRNRGKDQTAALEVFNASAAKGRELGSKSLATIPFARFATLHPRGSVLLAFLLTAMAIFIFLMA